MAAAEGRSVGRQHKATATGLGVGAIWDGHRAELSHAAAKHDAAEICPWASIPALLLPSPLPLPLPLQAESPPVDGLVDCATCGENGRANGCTGEELYYFQKDHRDLLRAEIDLSGTVGCDLCHDRLASEEAASGLGVDKAGMSLGQAVLDAYRT